MISSNESQILRLPTTPKLKTLELASRASDLSTATPTFWQFTRLLAPLVSSFASDDSTAARYCLSA
jgi:hypothetical protein